LANPGHHEHVNRNLSGLLGRFEIAFFESHEFLNTLVFVHRIVVGEYALAVD